MTLAPNKRHGSRASEQYRRTRRDHLGIIIMVIATILTISGLMLSLFFGILFMLVMIIVGMVLLLFGAYLDSNVRVRYQRQLPPIDQPRIVESDRTPTGEAIEPLSAYKHLSVPFGNFWVRYAYIIKELSKAFWLALLLNFAFAIYGYVVSGQIISGLLYLLGGFLLIVTLFFLFALWMLMNSYLFREKARLFPEGHPYQDKVLWNVRPGSMICKQGPARHRTRMDLEISHQVPRSWKGKRMGLFFTYPIHIYGGDPFLKHFHIPFPKDVEDGGLLRIYRLGLRFDSDISDVYFRVHMISLSRYRALAILWFIIGIVGGICYFWFLFIPLLTLFATSFGII
jgi:hypothetical protein